MADIIYLIPDFFNPGKMTASATPLPDAGRFGRPRPHSLLRASAGMWRGGVRPEREVVVAHFDPFDPLGDFDPFDDPEVEVIEVGDVDDIVLNPVIIPFPRKNRREARRSPDSFSF
ncbi:hypothetical protein [Methylosinus sp. LW3]|uniref:hypothetical protein n=1 Tax=Methylosinus sp. LW3 TaxID=107635 RepID=UPI0004633150|nr:hypothetical protein [Methylosinus sp. LW3]